MKKATKQNVKDISETEGAAIVSVFDEVERAFAAAEAEWHPTNLLADEERQKAWFPSLMRSFIYQHAAVTKARVLVKSPVEELFLAALWATEDLAGVRVILDSRESMVAVNVFFLGDPDEGVWLKIRPQAPVGKYVADFLIETNPMYGDAPPMRLAVEIDGHEFHEKTKEQAAHDKKRDRFFTSEGLPFLRFTGREVFRDAEGCVSEAIDFLKKKAAAK